MWSVSYQLLGFHVYTDIDKELIRHGVHGVTFIIFQSH
jgi:hypothetical protein